LQDNSSASKSSTPKSSTTKPAPRLRDAAPPDAGNPSLPHALRA
jgi:hypothetical protein